MLISIIYTIWIIVQAITAIVLVFPIISYIWYSLKPRKVTEGVDSSIITGDYAIIVTAYKHTGNLPNVVNSLLKLNYPQFLIYVVADDCPQLGNELDHEKVVVIRPNPVLANQIKSHFMAIDQFKRNHNRLCIIDSDNLVEANYLAETEKFFQAGYSAVQGVRKAKNLDTYYACIDAVNELYYLYYDRKLLFGIGSSSMLSGSGMAFTVDLYKECLGKLETEGAGFDKILQYEIMIRGYRMAFAEKAIVFDEKTSSADQLVKQRARWNNTWFRYCKFGLKLVIAGIKRFSLNQILFGFILLRPPLFILLMVSGLMMLANIFISWTAVFTWIGLFFLFTAGFFLALAKSDTDKRIYDSLVHLPKFIFMQILSLLKVRKANQFSVATEHSQHKQIEEVKH